MTDDDIHSQLVQWLRSLTGVEVIKAYQSGKALRQPYISVNLTTTRQLRQHAQDTEYEDGNTADMGTSDEFPPVTATPVIDAEWQFSCHAYGENPTQLLRPIRSAVQLPQKIEPLLPALVIHEVSQIRNIPDWINESWVPRAQIDIFIRGLTRDGFEIDVIEEAPVIIGRSH